MDTTDFAEVTKALGFDKLHSLSSLRLLPDHCCYATSPQQERQWIANVRGLELYLKSLVTRSKDDYNRTEQSLKGLPNAKSSTSQARLKPAAIAGAASINRESPVSNPLPESRIEVMTGGPKEQSMVLQSSVSAGPGPQKPPDVSEHLATEQLDTNSRQLRDATFSEHQKVHSRGTKRVSGVRNEMARKIVCLRPTESSDRVVQHLTKTCLHRHAMAKGVSRKTARSRQESSKSALNLLSVASALSDIVVPDFKAVRSDALDKKTEPGESHRVPSVSKPAPEQLFDDSRSTRPNTLTRLDSSSTSCHGKPTQSRGVLQGKLSSRRQELAPSDKDRTISNRDTGSRRQHQPVDMKSRSSSSDDAPYPSGNHSGGSPQYEARSSGSLQASKLQLSGLHVLFELTPSDFHGHDAKSIGKAGTRPVASVEQQKNEVAQIATLESFSPCIGAEQEVVPVAQTRSDRGRSSEEETLQDELSHRQQSSLDAMQKFVRKERRLLAKALLQLPSSGKLDVKDVPDNVGEAMKLLLKDSRSFLQWTLKAKREQLEREDTAAKARDKSSETEVKSDCAAESEISIPGIRCAAMMVNDIARVVRVALMLIVAIGIILSSV